MEWQDNEDGPDCTCGAPTVVKIFNGRPYIFCLVHTYEEGAMFPLPRNKKPKNWPNLSDNEIAQLVREGVKEIEMEGNSQLPPPQGGL